MVRSANTVGRHLVVGCCGGKQNCFPPWRQLSLQTSLWLVHRCVLPKADLQPCAASRLTLLFLQAAGLRRTWEKQSYTCQALALLTGRHRAYGYRHAERFLSELAEVSANTLLTEALARWTASLWEKGVQGRENPFPVFYPLLVTTHRGDQHLTMGLPAILTHYEHAAGMARLKRIVVVSFGMSAEFLAMLVGDGRTVVTVLRTDQYTGVESFREVGEFVPLQVDRQGKIIRELLRATRDLAQQEREMYELDAPFGPHHDGLQGGFGESGHVGARSLFSGFVRSR
jgi:hypothetical protein